MWIMICFNDYWEIMIVMFYFFSMQELPSQSCLPIGVSWGCKDGSNCLKVDVHLNEFLLYINCMIQYPKALQG